MCCLGLFMCRRCPRASPRAATALGSRTRIGAERTSLIEEHGVLRFATLDHHRIAIAAATSSTRKMGSNTGGTSHSRKLNVESSRI